MPKMKTKKSAAKRFKVRGRIDQALAGFHAPHPHQEVDEEEAQAARHHQRSRQQQARRTRDAAVLGLRSAPCQESNAE